MKTPISGQFTTAALALLTIFVVAVPAAAQQAPNRYQSQVDVAGGILEVQARLPGPDETDRPLRVQLLFAREDTLISIDVPPTLASELRATLSGEGRDAVAGFDLAVSTAVIARHIEGVPSLEFLCTDDVGCVPAGPLIVVAFLSASERATISAALDSASAVFGPAAPSAVTEPPPQETAPAVEPEEPAAPAVGLITVNAIPFATVELDGRRLGDTPLVNIEVEPGDHTVRFVREGYVTEERNVTVSAGELIRVVVRMRRQ